MASKVSGYIGQINPGDGTNYAIGSTAYGVCETGPTTVNKIVDMTGFTLIEGATIHVRFQFGNSVTTPALNVNGTGAKTIIGSNTSWEAGDVGCFTYDGTNWRVNYCERRDYAECSTGASTAEKTISIPGISLRFGLTVHVKFAYTNTATNPTLKLNNAEAKSLYLYGTTAVGTTENTSWKAGQTVSFTYDGTAWYMNDYQSGRLLVFDVPSFSSLPQTINDDRITEKHTVLRYSLGSPAAQSGTWTVTTSGGSAVISGTMASNSSTTMKITLGLAENL